MKRHSAWVLLVLVAGCQAPAWSSSAPPVGVGASAGPAPTDPGASEAHQAPAAQVEAPGPQGRDGLRLGHRRHLPLPGFTAEALASEAARVQAQLADKVGPWGEGEAHLWRGSLRITTPEQLAAARRLGEIQGDLEVELAASSGVSLPLLTKVGGKVSVPLGPGASRAAFLPRLRELGDRLAFNGKARQDDGQAAPRKALIVVADDDFYHQE